jgi:hypothetical protein
VETLNCNLAYGYRIFFSRQKSLPFKVIGRQSQLPSFLANVLRKKSSISDIYIIGRRMWKDEEMVSFS